MRHYARQAVEEIRDQVGKEKVILGLSGGVDSSVAAALIHRAIGKRLACIFCQQWIVAGAGGAICERSFWPQF